MTKVGRLIEEEKLEAVNEARMEEKRESALKMIELDMDNVQIMKVTGLTRKQIEELKDNLSISK